MPPVRTHPVTRASRKRTESMGTPARGRGQAPKRCKQSTLSTSPIVRPLQDQPTLAPVSDDANPSVLDDYPSVSTSADSTLGLGESFQYEPNQVVSCLDSLGAFIPGRIKSQIWEGKFIDLSLLIKTTNQLQDFDSQGELQIKEGRLCLVKPRNNSYLTIEKWTNAFMIFTSIMLEKFPTRAQELLKYMRDIRLAATRSNYWFSYDEQFRLRIASQPHLSWGIINQELWLLYISNSSRPESRTRTNSQQTQGSQSDRVNRTAVLYCNHYNKGTSCPFFPRCRYQHGCSKCGENHPSFRCSK